MDFAIKNLAEVEDQAPRFGAGDVQEARFPREDLGSETIGLAFHRVRPGCRQAFAHRHDEAEEIYVILSGSGRIKLGDELRRNFVSSRKLSWVQLKGRGGTRHGFFFVTERM